MSRQERVDERLAVGHIKRLEDQLGEPRIPAEFGGDEEAAPVGHEDHHARPGSDRGEQVVHELPGGAVHLVGVFEHDEQGGRSLDSRARGDGLDEVDDRTLQPNPYGSPVHSPDLPGRLGVAEDVEQEDPGLEELSAGAAVGQVLEELRQARLHPPGQLGVADRDAEVSPEELRHRPQGQAEEPRRPCAQDNRGRAELLLHESLEVLEKPGLAVALRCLDGDDLMVGRARSADGGHSLPETHHLAGATHEGTGADEGDRFTPRQGA